MMFFPMTKLAENARNFISANLSPSGDKTDMYIFDYTVCNENDKADFISKLSSSAENNDVALIELYSHDVISSGSNFVFRQLLSDSAENNNSFGIADLTAFSAWNTSANAIGLGFANAGVYSLAKQHCTDFKAVTEGETKMLAQLFTMTGFISAEQEIIFLPKATNRQKKKCFQAVSYTIF